MSERNIHRRFIFRFQIPELKAGNHMMDVRTPDGSIVKISAACDQDLSKSIGVDISQYINKVIH